MKRYLIIGTVIALCFGFSACGIYNKYKTPEPPAKDNLFGSGDEIGQASNEASIAEMSWREFFADPLLQQLIDSALSRNTDIKSARLAVEKAQAALKAAKLGYLPSISLAPTGSVSSVINGATAWTYNVPLSLNWDVEVFGTITTNKRKTKAMLLQAEAQQDAVRANIIATVAQQYNMLQLLDKQLEILTVTDSLWNLSLETQHILAENGKCYSTAVNQMESSYLNVKMQIVDVKRSIRQVENALCRLLVQPPQSIARNPWESYRLPQRIGTGVPAAMLANRPDVRVADHRLEEAFYNTASARAAFYPGLSLQGTFGWTNNIGQIVDPAQFILSAAATLVQPLFAQGKIAANLKISKRTQEDMLNQYVQTIINAGNQVNEALADCQVAKEKDEYYRRQVEVLQDTYMGTHELMDNGKANYIEVLTAQESLLSAQLNEAMNRYNGTQSLIALYIALGGATK